LRFFKPSLRFRILYFITSVSLGIVLISTLLLFGYQRKELIEITQSSAVTLSDLVKANLRHAMLTGDKELVNQTVKSIMAVREIDTLRILNNQGVVSASSVAAEVGSQVNQADLFCQACHAGVPQPPKDNAIFTQADGRQVMLTANVIQNQEECQTCHSPENQMLGIMIVETPLTRLNQTINTNFWQTALVIVAAFALLTGLIAPMINRRIIRPLEKLSSGVAEISKGNLDNPVAVKYSGELGELARSFESMRQQLKISHSEMEHRERELAIMNEVGLAATQLLELPKILEFALDTMIDRLGMADARLFLYDEETGRYTMRAGRGVSQAQNEEIERRRQAGWDITQEVVDTGQAVFVPHMVTDDRLHGVWDHLQDRSYLNMPLLTRGTVIGTLGMVTPVGRILTAREVEFLIAVGREIGIAIDNALLLAKAQQSEKQAIALYELGTKISATLALDNAIYAVAQAARELMDAEISLVGLMDEDNQKVTLNAAIGVQADKLVGMAMVRRGEPLWVSLMEEQHVILEASHTDQLSPFIRDLFKKEQITSMLLVPLHRADKFMGLIEVMTRQPRRYTPRNAQLLSRLAQKVTVSLENAQLYRQLRYMAALEERDRLAREMHDRLSQGLGYLKIRATIADDLLSGGQLEGARESLLELKRASQMLYTDVREEIFNLRTTITDHLGFFATLEDYLADYKTHYGLEVELEMDDECYLDVSPEAAGQLLRIIQEALSNVRRHSGAGNATIRCFVGRDGQIRISIEDHGQGFLPDQVHSEAGQHIGLQIMRERAESIGGSLELDSQPGQGTRVNVQIPAAMPKEEKSSHVTNLAGR
jgi:nitrate/nitrite-specific signal transduction histidine kinase